MKKLVGVMPLWDEEKKSLWMLPGYIDGLRAAGLDAFIFPLTDDKSELERLSDMCDGFLLTGGQDVNPRLYNEYPINDSVEWNDIRDREDSFILGYSVKNNRSVLGICRGIQLINAALGGSLYQDIPEEKPSSVVHHMSAPYDRASHSVDIIHGTPLYDLIKKDNIRVNSIHHQAVKRLSDSLLPMAVSEDGITEAVYMPDKNFIWGVQWHPEYWFRTNDDCMKIFTAFAGSMR